MLKNPEPRLGDIFLVNFTGHNSEQSGLRPALVFQNNTGNTYSPNVIALPLTSCTKKLTLPTHVLLTAESSGLLKDSVVLCENPKEVSKNRLQRYITTLTDDQIRSVAIGNLLATSAISYLDESTLLDVYRQACQLNSC